MAAGDIGFSGAVSLVTLMDTDLNSLASTALNVGGTMIDNTSNEHHHIVFELVLASVDLSAAVNPRVDLYLCPSADGTNYADSGTDASTTAMPVGSFLVDSFWIEATNAAHRSVVVLKDYLLNIKYKPALRNMTGANFAASGNTLKAGTTSTAIATA